MEFRNLGGSGVKVSIVGIGCNNFGRRCDADTTRSIVNAAVDNGINFFDTADIYGPRGLSEEYLGAALKEHDRSSLVIATKFAGPMGDAGHLRGASRRYIMSAVEASLRRLDTDYIDLYQQHMPDGDTPVEETLRALDDLVSSGKVRYLGSSNYTGWQIADAEWTSRSLRTNRFVTAQNLFSLLERGVEPDVLGACRAYEVGMLPFFPLASGLLTGKYSRGNDAPEGTRLAGWGERGKQALSDRNFDIVDRLNGYAAEAGHTLLELAMSWLASQPVVSSVIAGATSTEQVEQNAAAADWQMSVEEVREVRALTAA